MEDILTDACDRARRYVSQIGTRRVSPALQDTARLMSFREPVPEAPSHPADVLAILDEVGSPATVASTCGRYFGFVTGGTLPVAMAASWMTTAWDQNAALQVMSPVASAVEDVTREWLIDLLNMPASCGVGFVTGATMANLTCLAAARHALLKRVGWNAEEDGLFGAPPINVIVGDEVHVSLLKALSILGLGKSRVVRIATDSQGRMKPDLLPSLDARTILCLQAGNVNTGSFDPAREICGRALEAKAWIHVDGAFGLWASAAPRRTYLMDGFEGADSWATDCHKWLNVPYDSGLAFVRDPQHLRSAMALNASYLQTTDSREPSHYTPEASRRARASEVWAVLRSLGRQGLAELLERSCQFATRFAGAFTAAGYQVLNEVALNQVLVSFGDDLTTRRIISQVQQEGTCWCGGTEWHGKAAMRLSISCWATTEQDVDQSVEAILGIARMFAVNHGC